MSSPDSDKKAKQSDAAADSAGADHNPVGAWKDARLEEIGGGVAIVADSALPQEVGGRKGPDPTRYGDWEQAGRCIDF